MTLEEGQILLREGDLDFKMYIVRSGELEGTNTRNSSVNSYGPGSLIGELGLLKNEPSAETISVTEDCELQVITQDTLQDALETEPVWFKSIIQFLTSRLSIAQNNKLKSDKIKALPSVLYLLKSQFEAVDSNGDTKEIDAKALCNEVRILFNVEEDMTRELLQTLHELDTIKLQGEKIGCNNPRLVALLYESIRTRAVKKKVSPDILSMTDQMVLSAIIKAVQNSREPLKNGTFTVTTEELSTVAKRALFGVTLTTRTVLPLIKRGIIEPSVSIENQDSIPDIENIPYFTGDFDKVLDLMELNRIYPLLDKKLV